MTQNPEPRTQNPEPKTLQSFPPLREEIAQATSWALSRFECIAEIEVAFELRVKTPKIRGWKQSEISQT